MTVLSLFSRASRWTKFNLVRGHGAAKCYCLIGALEHKYGMDAKKQPSKQQERAYHNAFNRVKAAIVDLYPGFHGGIAAFNDHQSTTIQDIRAVARRARV